MKDFGQWFKEQAPIPVRTDAERHIEELLEEGVLQEVQGGYEAKCRCCGEWRELYVGPDEIDLGYEHYCGGSPSCCP